jgi:guanine deaminase
MCLAAAFWARLDRICYGADRRDAEAAGFDDRRFYETFPHGLPLKQMMREEAREPFRKWMAKKDRIPY